MNNFSQNSVHGSVRTNRASIGVHSATLCKQMVGLFLSQHVLNFGTMPSCAFPEYWNRNRFCVLVNSSLDSR